MKVLYFGIYDPNYARNWVLINGLKANDVEVIELRRRPSRLNFIKLFFDYIRLKEKFDIMIVGFPGQEVMFLAKLLCRKPIIFDAFTSHYGGYILDRKKYSRNGLRAKYYRFLDKWSCKLANLVLLDTQAHINFFLKEYNLPKEKFRRIFVGVSGENIASYTAINNVQDKFKVLFFGTYIPLQGVEFIIRAAKILENEPEIVFNLIGAGQEREKNENLAKELELKNVKFQGMISIEKLREEIANSDISLGIFGGNPKTSLVIPNKIYEALAIGKPIITADTEAIRELFDENDMVLIPPADEKSLAEAILKLRNDPALRDRLAVNGHKKFMNSLSYQILGGQLKNIINNLLNDK